jgi:hypothetical protein
MFKFWTSAFLLTVAALSADQPQEEDNNLVAGRDSRAIRDYENADNRNYPNRNSMSFDPDASGFIERNWDSRPSNQRNYNNSYYNNRPYDPPSSYNANFDNYQPYYYYQRDRD